MKIWVGQIWQQSDLKLQIFAGTESTARVVLVHELTKHANHGTRVRPAYVLPSPSSRAEPIIEGFLVECQAISRSRTFTGRLAITHKQAKDYLAMYGAAAGALGMNVDIEIFEDDVLGDGEF